MMEISNGQQNTKESCIFQLSLGEGKVLTPNAQKYTYFIEWRTIEHKVATTKQQYFANENGVISFKENLVIRCQMQCNVQTGKYFSNETLILLNMNINDNSQVRLIGQITVDLAEVIHTQSYLVKKPSKLSYCAEQCQLNFSVAMVELRETSFDGSRTVSLAKSKGEFESNENFNLRENLMVRSQLSSSSSKLRNRKSKNEVNDTAKVNKSLLFENQKRKQGQKPKIPKSPKYGESASSSNQNEIKNKQQFNFNQAKDQKEKFELIHELDNQDTIIKQLENDITNIMQMFQASTTEIIKLHDEIDTLNNGKSKDLKKNNQQRDKNGQEQKQIINVYQQQQQKQKIQKKIKNKTEKKNSNEFVQKQRSLQKINSLKSMTDQLHKNNENLKAELQKLQKSDSKSQLPEQSVCKQLLDKVRNLQKNLKEDNINQSNNSNCGQKSNKDDIKSDNNNDKNHKGKDFYDKKNFNNFDQSITLKNSNDNDKNNNDNNQNYKGGKILLQTELITQDLEKKVIYLQNQIKNKNQKIIVLSQNIIQYQKNIGQPQIKSDKKSINKNQENQENQEQQRLKYSIKTSFFGEKLVEQEQKKVQKEIGSNQFQQLQLRNKKQFQLDYYELEKKLQKALKQINSLQNQLNEKNKIIQLQLQEIKNKEMSNSQNTQNLKPKFRKKFNKTIQIQIQQDYEIQKCKKFEQNQQQKNKQQIQLTIQKKKNLYKKDKKQIKYKEQKLIEQNNKQKQINMKLQKKIQKIQQQLQLKNKLIQSLLKENLLNQNNQIYKDCIQKNEEIEVNMPMQENVNASQRRQKYQFLWKLNQIILLLNDRTLELGKVLEENRQLKCMLNIGNSSEEQQDSQSLENQQNNQENNKEFQQPEQSQKQNHYHQELYFQRNNNFEQNNQQLSLKIQS